MKSGNIIVPPNSTTAWEEQIRIVVGCVIFLSNMLLLVFLNMHAPMRRQYVFFTLVAVGDVLDSMYLIYPSIMRMMEIDACKFWEETTLWECTSKGYMMLRIYGTELVSLTMLVMTAEKLLAVLLPVVYRRYVTNTARFIAALACLLICVLSLTTMILTSFFNPRNVIQQNKYCGISGSVVNRFAEFHHFFILSCQIGAFLGSGFAFLVAKNIRKHANKVELSSIRPILVVSFISCIVVSSNNIIYILKNFVKINISKTQQNYVVSSSSALFQVSKFALYVLTGQEFRNSLQRVFKCKSCCPQTQIPAKRISVAHTNSQRRRS